MAEREYRRLTRARSRPGLAISFAGRYSLWLGRDHLLSIESTGYAEKYKRFYFRDIQAVVIRKTDGWIGWSIAIVVVAFLSLAFAAVASDSTARWIFASVGTLFLLLLILHLMGGPSCTCHVRTAVHLELLPSLNRVRRARKALAVLAAEIAAAQGVLSPEDILARAQQSQTPDAAPPVPPVATEPLGSRAQSPSGSALPPIIGQPGA